MNLELNDAQVVVVGGTNGIGLSISNNFLLEGAIVHIISRNYNKDVVTDLENKFKNKVFFYQSDATNESALFIAYEQILKNSKNKIDILISNVGSGSGEKKVIPSKFDWDMSWDINFKSAFNSVKIFTEKIAESNGSITFISSIAGKEFIGAPISYSTAKNALISFAKSLSHILAPNVRVNTIAPGNIWVKGGVWEIKEKNNPLEVSRMLTEKVPLNRFGHPDEVSNLVLFISSKKASFITGSCYVIDGGQTTNY